MTCETVRERLFEESTASFGDLESHLSQCPECAQLAQRIRDDELALRQHLEAFVNAPLPDTLPDGAAAVGSGGPRWFHGALVVLAIAAVLVVTVLQPTEVEPEREVFHHANPPDALMVAEGMVDDFLDLVEAGLPERDGLSRAEEDELMVAYLGELSGALLQTETQLTPMVEDEDPLVAVIVLWELASTYEGMANALEFMAHPSYLTESQSEVYQMALEDKAWVQRDKARSVRVEALEVAEEAGLDAEAASLQSAIVEFEEATAAREAEKARALLETPWKAEELTELVDGVEVTLDGCADRLDSGSVDEIRAVLEQARAVVDAGETSMFDDTAALVEVYFKGLEQACE